MIATLEREQTKTDILDTIRDGGPLNWSVEKVPVYAGEGWDVPIPNTYATLRTDTGRPFGIVSNRFSVIQNDRAALAVLDLCENANLQLVEARELRGGEAVVWTLRFPEITQFLGIEGEEMELYLVAVNGHRRRRFTVMPSLNRITCDNQLTAAAIGAASCVWSVRHTGDIEQKLADIGRTTVFAEDFEARLTAMADRMLSDRVTAEQADTFVKQLIRPDRSSDPNRAASERTWAENKQKSLLEVWANTPDLEKIRETKYGLLQAVAAYEIHHKHYRSSTARSAEERRFEVRYGIDGSETLTERAASILSRAGFSEVELIP